MSYVRGSSARVWVSAVLCAVALTCVAAPASAAPQPRDRSVVGRYADALGGANARLPVAVRRDLAERLLLLSSYYKLDPCLLAAVVSVESAWRANAVSPVGALGYGQLMPGTAAGLDVNALEPYENLDGTARYLRRMLMRYQKASLQTRMRLALASYNAGPAAVTRYHGVPPYRETRAYVDNVLRTRAVFVATVATPPRYDVASLLATPHARAPASVRSRRVAASIRKTHPSHAPHVTVARPQRLALALPPPPVEYERSRSFVARMLGLRHRVPAPAAVAVKDPADSQSDDRIVLPP